MLALRVIILLPPGGFSDSVILSIKNLSSASPEGEVSFIFNKLRRKFLQEDKSYAEMSHNQDSRNEEGILVRPLYGCIVEL